MPTAEGYEGTGAVVVVVVLVSNIPEEEGGEGKILVCPDVDNVSRTSLDVLDSSVEE